MPSVMRTYAATAADFLATTDAAGAIHPALGQTIAIYDAITAGTQVTTLYDMAGNVLPSGLATSDATDGTLRFKALGQPSDLWGDNGAGKRFLFRATDIGVRVDALEGTTVSAATQAQIDTSVAASVASATGTINTNVTNLTTSVNQLAASETATQAQLDALSTNVNANYARLSGSGATGQILYWNASTRLFTFGDPPTGGGTVGGTGTIGVIAAPSDTLLALLPVGLPGVPVTADNTLATVEVKLAVPAIGSAASLVTNNFSGATVTTVNTLTVPALARRAFVSSLSVGIAADDELRPEFTAVGSTYAGAGPQVRFYATGVARPAVLAAPSAVTGLTATAAVGAVNLAWTTVTGASEYLVTRTSAGVVTILGWVRTTAYSDTGGAPGTTYTYTVYAANADMCAAGATVSGASTSAATGSVFYTGAQIASTDATHFTRTPQNGSLAASGSSGIFTTGATGSSDNPRVQRTASTSETLGTNILRTKVTMVYRFPLPTGGMYIKTRRNSADTQGTRVLISYGGAGSGRIGQRAPGAGGTTDYSSTTYPSSSVTLSHTTTATYVAEVIDDPSLGTNGTIEVRVWDQSGSRPSAATFSVAPTTTELTAANMPAGQVCWDEQSFGTTPRGFELVSSTVVDMAI